MSIPPKVNQYHIIHNLLLIDGLDVEAYIEDSHIHAVFARGAKHTAKYIALNTHEYPQELRSLMNQIDRVMGQTTISNHQPNTELNKSDSLVLNLATYSSSDELTPKQHILQFLILMYIFCRVQRSVISVNTNAKSLVDSFNKNLRNGNLLDIFEIGVARIKVKEGLAKISKGTANDFTLFCASFFKGKYDDTIKELFELVTLSGKQSKHVKGLLYPEEQNQQPNVPEYEKQNKTKPVNLKEYSKSTAEVLLLPGVTYSIFPEDITKIATCLIDDVASGSPEAIYCYLALVLAKKHNELDDFVVSDVLSAHTDLLIKKDAIFWCRRDAYLPQSHKPQTPLAEHYHEHNNLILLRLHSALQTFFASITSPTYLSEYLNVSDKQINDYLLRLKERVGIPYGLSFKVLRFANFAKLAHETDPAFASLVFSNTSFANASTLYYLYASHRVIANAFYRTVEVDCKADAEAHADNTYAGSQVCIKRSYLSSVVEDTFLQLNRFSNYRYETDVEKLVHHHNLFVAYILFAFSLLTALRESKHVVFDSVSMDLKRQIVYVSDKNVHGLYASRILPIPDELILQVKHFISHLRWMAKRLVDTSPDIAAAMYGLSKQHSVNYAMFSFIDNGNLIAPSSDFVFKYLTIPDYLPRNVLRHFMCSHLPLEVSYLRQYMLGHVVSGNSPVAGFTMTPLPTMRELKHAFAQVLDDLQFKTFEVPACKGKMHAFSELPEKLWVPKNWVERIELRATAFKALKQHINFAYLRSLTAPEEITVEFNNIRETLDKTFKGQYGLGKLHKAAYGILSRWEKFFLKVSNKTYRSRFLQKEGLLVNVNPLQLFEAKNTNNIKQAYLNYRRHHRLSCQFDILLSVACFQPYSIDYLYKNPFLKLHIESINGMLVIHKDDEAAMPINSFTGLLLVNESINQVIEFELDFLALQREFQDFLVYLREEGAQTQSFSGFNNFARYMLDKDIFLYSALVRYDFSNDKPSISLNQTDKRRIFANYYPDFVPKNTAFAELTNRNLTNATVSLAEQKKLIKQVMQAFFHNTVTTKNNTALLFETLRSETSLDITVFDDLEALALTFFPVTRYLLLFAYEECKRLKANRNPLSKKTIAQYMRVYASLFKAIGKMDMSDLEGEEIEAIYSSIIEEYKQREQASIAKDLYRFHQAVSRHVTFEAVDWIGITKDPSYVNDRSSCATVISGDEYQRAKLYLRRNKDLTDDEKVIHEALLILSMKVGLRRAEASHLELDSIDVENWSIYIHTNGYFKTKSINSNRKFSIVWLLNDDEKVILRRMREICSEHVTVKQGRKFLFLTANAKEAIIDVHRTYANITTALQFATGLNHVRIHDCRHTFINMQYLLFSGAYRHPVVTPVLQSWFNSDDLATLQKRAIKAITGESHFPHNEKLPYAIAQTAGHHVETERVSYLHCLDVIAYTQVENFLADYVTWPTWLSIAGLSNKQPKLSLTALNKRIVKRRRFKPLGKRKPPSDAIFEKPPQFASAFKRYREIHLVILGLLAENDRALELDAQANDTKNIILKVYNAAWTLPFVRAGLPAWEGFIFPKHPITQKRLQLMFHQAFFLKLLKKFLKLSNKLEIENVMASLSVSSHYELDVAAPDANKLMTLLDELSIKHSAKNTIKKRFSVVNTIVRVTIKNDGHHYEDLMFIYLLLLWRIENH